MNEKIIQAMKHLTVSFPRTKFYLAGIGLTAFLGVIIILFLNLSISKNTVSEPKPLANTRDADMNFQNIHYTSTNEQGVKEWELTALAANYFQEKKLAEFENVDITFYYQEGRIFTLRGDMGLLNIETRDIKLSGHVTGTTNDGYRFRTESLNYDAKKHQAKTEDKAFLDGPQFTLEGKGMVVDMEGEKVLLLNDVQARGKK